MKLTGFFYGHLGHKATYNHLFSNNYWTASLEHYAQQLAENEKAEYEKFKAQDARIAYWRSDAEGRACNHTPPRNITERNEPRNPGMGEIVSGNLTLCTSSALHATLRPPRWNGSRLWIVALLGEVIGDDEKFASQHRIIIGEVPQWSDENG